MPRDLIGKVLASGFQHWAVVTTVIGWAAAFYAWVRKTRAETRFKEIQKRAEAPFLIATSLSAHDIADPVCYVDMLEHSEMLDEFSERLGSERIEMRQRFDNEGQRVRAVSVVQPSPISFVNVGNAIYEGASPGWIRYVYDRDTKGHAQRFSFQFESLAGFKQVHVYELIHGVRSLRRIDPA
jgi:hypothetical protein